jgi:hypothetical protein
VSCPSIARDRSDSPEDPLLGRARRGRVAARRVVGELADERLQRLAEPLPEPNVDQDREEDRSRLHLDRLPEIPLPVALGQEADEVAADQVVVPHEGVTVEVGEIAASEAPPRHTGGEGAVPERPGQPPHPRLQRRLVVDRQPFVEPAVEAELRRVDLAEDLVDEPGEPGHLVEVNVVGQLVAGDRSGVGRQPHLQRERVDRLVGRDDGERLVAGDDRHRERVVERQVRHDEREAPVGDAVVDQRARPQLPRTPLDVIREPQGLVVVVVRVVDLEVRRLEPPHRLLGQRRRHVLRHQRRHRGHAGRERDRGGQRRARDATLPLAGRRLRHRPLSVCRPGVYDE